MNILLAKIDFFLKPLFFLIECYEKNKNEIVRKFKDTE